MDAPLLSQRRPLIQAPEAIAQAENASTPRQALLFPGTEGDSSRLLDEATGGIGFGSFDNPSSVSGIVTRGRTAAATRKRKFAEQLDEPIPSLPRPSLTGTRKIRPGTPTREPGPTSQSNTSAALPGSVPAAPQAVAPVVPQTRKSPHKPRGIAVSEYAKNHQLEQHSVRDEEFVFLHDLCSCCYRFRVTTRPDMTSICAIGVGHGSSEDSGWSGCLMKTFSPSVIP
jgi:hypothetical protein